MRFHSLRVVRAMVLGLCVASITPLATVWAASAPAAECHDCCPDGLRSAPAQNCCVAAPAAPTVPSSARVTVVAGFQSAPLQPVFAWSEVPARLADVRTADPPLRPMPVLFRTSVLLI